MEDDGQKRHLYQLKAKKEEILQLIPDKTLKQTLEYMQTSIHGLKFPQSLCKCVLASKFKRVDSLFVSAFDELQLQQKVNYYRKYIQSALLIVKKKSRFPQTNNLLEDLPSSREIISIQYKLKQEKRFKDLTATLDTTAKIFESPLFCFDFHQTFISKVNSPQEAESYILLSSWKDSRKDLCLKSHNGTLDVLFQRIQKIYCEAIQQNIYRILDGQYKARVSSSNEQNAPTERSLDIRLNASRNQAGQAKHTIKDVEILNYLKYRHPVQPQGQPHSVKRLIPSKGNKHYFLEDDWEVDSQGELVATNQSKLQAQGSVIKYIIKRLFTGAKLFHISLPVTVFNEESNLSLLMCSYAYAPAQLEPAGLQANPLNRFLKVVRFNLLGPCSYIRCDKPFNPLLGETYQAIVNGNLFYGQQISHHPPVSAVFIKGKNYTAHGNFQAQLKFGANSAAGNNKGWLKISFDTSNISKKIVRVNNIPGQMGGMLIGKRTLNLTGKSYYIDEENMIFLSLVFGQVKLKKTKEYNDSVEGKIVKLKRGTPLDKPQQISEKDIQQQLGIIWGRWLSQVYFNDSLLVDTRQQHPLEIERYQGLLPSDYSLRQDISLKRRGADIQQCQRQKERLQEIQRNDRKLREKYGH